MRIFLSFFSFPLSFSYSYRIVSPYLLLQKHIFFVSVFHNFFFLPFNIVNDFFSSLFQILYFHIFTSFFIFFSTLFTTFAILFYLSYLILLYFYLYYTSIFLPPMNGLHNTPSHFIESNFLLTQTPLRQQPKKLQHPPCLKCATLHQTHIFRQLQKTNKLPPISHKTDNKTEPQNKN